MPTSVHMRAAPLVPGIFTVFVLAAVLPAGASMRQGVDPDGSFAFADPESVGVSSAGLDEVTALLSQFVEEGRIAGAVAGVARNGRNVYLEAVGFQDLERRAPMVDRSVFRIYSMAKAVTSVAAMMLWEEGRFDLDDPVSRYMPQFSTVRVRDADGTLRAPSREVTVRDLILHTSGLSHRTSALYRDAEVRRRDITMTQFIENIVREPLMEDPGTRYRYSEGTTVLGGLVEIWSGMPLDTFMDERIFRPLGMVDTGFHVRPDQFDRFTTVYGRTDTGALVPIELEDIPFTDRPALFEGAVGLVSTVPDYLRFAQMLLDRGELAGTRLLRPETVDRMIQNGLADEVLQARPGSMGWGLANVNVVLDPTALNYPAGDGEYGWDGSAGTIFWNDPVSGTVIVLMWQSSPANPDSLRQRIKTLVHAAIVD